MIKFSVRLFLLVGLQAVLGCSETQSQSPVETLNIRGSKAGRVFEGVGAVSAGASSRLLIDYPEPYRSHVLDYLFKPGFGASFVYLKTEIGGDGNTTCGSEPSFARTREEMNAPNYNRGYEYWLMKEASNRNAAIELDALEWSMPGWFKQIWGQDNANYLVKFIEGANKHWGVNMNYIGGCWNERTYDRNWIVDTLRPTLDRNGLSHIKIGAPEGAGKAWAISDLLLKDEKFRNTIANISYHYPDSYMWRPGTELAGQTSFDTGLPLWSGEDFSLPGKPWKNTTYLAKNVLKCYIKQKITRVNLWCPIASMPDIACFSNVGIMKGVSPWSGYYEVWPAIWGVAHFNQFVKPGWQYIDDACGEFSGDGAYGTYKSADGKNDYSIVIVSGAAPKKLNFDLDGLASKKLYIWKSNEAKQFQQVKVIAAKNGQFTIDVDAESIYTITTTTGQSKGEHKIPADKIFPTSHADNFDQYPLDRAPLSPKFFYDNSGAFEITKLAGESGTLRQMLRNDITHWIPDECAYTYVAQGTDWEDGTISSDVLVEENAFNGTGYAGLIMRSSYDKAGQANIPYGYRFSIWKDGYWRLQTKQTVLDSGKVDPGVWHKLQLSCKGNLIEARIDGNLVCSKKDDTYQLGAAGYVSGFNYARFDNLQLDYTPVKGVKVSEWKTASSSTERQAQEAWNAVDGNSLSKWNATRADSVQWLKVDLGTALDIVRCETYMEYMDAPARYQIEYSLDNKTWKKFVDRSANKHTANPCYVDESNAKARWVRITIEPDAKRKAIAIHEFRVYKKP